MSDHPSHPDQLMARALGVCWHSPGLEPMWACAPLADWERELICRRCGASGCNCDARCGDVHGSGDVCNRPTNHPGWHHVDGSGGLGWTS